MRPAVFAAVYAMAAFGTMQGARQVSVANCLAEDNSGRLMTAAVISGVIWPLTIASEIMAPAPNLCGAGR